VRIQKLQQTFADSRTPATTAAKTSTHCVPLVFVDEAVVVRVESVEHLWRKLAGKLIAADLAVLVFVQFRKGRHLKLPHLTASTLRGHWRPVLRKRCKAHYKNENQ